MTGRVGRQVNFFFGGDSPLDEILGVREKTIDLNGEPIDVTADEDNGVRTLLDNLSAQDEVNVGISGVSKDRRLKTAWFTQQRTQTCRFEYPDGSTMTGTFFLSTFKETEPYKDASTFEASLVSSGLVVYTPGP